MVLRRLAALALGVCLWLGAGTAHAQYKNTSYGFDAGFWWIYKPGLSDDRGRLLAVDNRPIRLSMGARIGGEFNYKLDADRWWFTSRLTVGLLSFLPATGNSVEVAYDQEANRTMGTIMSVHGQIGIRYLLLTDRIRPYLQAGVGYTPLLAFSSVAGENCSTCTGIEPTTNHTAFLPHQNVGTIHFQPGVEWVFSRDMAFHFFIDTQFWFIINTAPNISLVPSFGILFFT